MSQLLSDSDLFHLGVKTDISANTWRAGGSHHGESSLATSCCNFRQQRCFFLSFFFIFKPKRVTFSNWIIQKLHDLNISWILEQLFSWYLTTVFYSWRSPSFRFIHILGLCFYLLNVTGQRRIKWKNNKTLYSPVSKCFWKELFPDQVGQFQHVCQIIKMYYYKLQTKWHQALLIQNIVYKIYIFTTFQPKYVRKYSSCLHACIVRAVAPGRG